jgi:hypothetical protein
LLTRRSSLRYHCIQYPEPEMNLRFEHPEKKAPAKKVRLSRARQVAILKALADPRRYELLERIAKAG